MSCGIREPSIDRTAEALLGVWDNMGNKVCYERYIFYKGDTFAFYNRRGVSTGSYNLNLEQKKLGLYHQAASADYMPFVLLNDGRMQVFRDGQYKNFIKVPMQYAGKVECPGEIPDEDDGGGDYPSPNPTPTPTPPMPNPDDGQCECECECDCDSITKSIKNLDYIWFPIPRIPSPLPPQPTPPPSVEPCKPCPPCPTCPQPQPSKKKCKCKCKCTKNKELLS